MAKRNHNNGFELFDVESVVSENQKAKAKEQIKPSTRKMMAAMLSMGMDRECIAALLEMSELPMPLIQYFAGPIIVHQNAWRDIIPSWVFQAIICDRLEVIFSEFDADSIGSFATPGEVLAVMMPVVMEVPLRSDWVDVYLWAAAETLHKHNRLKDGKTYWEITGDKPIPYKAVKENFEEVSRDIRYRVVEHSKSRGWGKRRKVANVTEEVFEEVEENKENDEPVVIQTDLFSMFDQMG